MKGPGIGEVLLWLAPPASPSLHETMLQLHLARSFRTRRAHRHKGNADAGKSNGCAKVLFPCFTNYLSEDETVIVRLVHEAIE